MTVTPFQAFVLEIIFYHKVEKLDSDGDDCSLLIGRCSSPSNYTENTEDR